MVAKKDISTAAIPTIVPSHVFGAVAPSNQITLGLIGTGIHGAGWNLDGFKRCKDARILSVCDVVKSRREANFFRYLLLAFMVVGVVMGELIVFLVLTASTT